MKRSDPVIRADEVGCGFCGCRTLTGAPLLFLPLRLERLFVAFAGGANPVVFACFGVEEHFACRAVRIVGLETCMIFGMKYQSINV